MGPLPGLRWSATRCLGGPIARVASAIPLGITGRWETAPRFAAGPPDLRPRRRGQCKVVVQHPACAPASARPAAAPRGGCCPRPAPVGIPPRRSRAASRPRWRRRSLGYLLPHWFEGLPSPNSRARTLIGVGQCSRQVQPADKRGPSGLGLTARRPPRFVSACNVSLGGRRAQPAALIGDAHGVDAVAGAELGDDDGRPHARSGTTGGPRRRRCGAPAPPSWSDGVARLPGRLGTPWATDRSVPSRVVRQRGREGAAVKLVRTDDDVHFQALYEQLAACAYFPWSPFGSVSHLPLVPAAGVLSVPSLRAGPGGVVEEQGALCPRTLFQARWGQAAELADDTMGQLGGRPRVLPDVARRHRSACEVEKRSGTCLRAHCIEDVGDWGHLAAGERFGDPSDLPGHRREEGQVACLHAQAEM